MTMDPARNLAPGTAGRRAFAAARRANLANPAHQWQSSAPAAARSPLMQAKRTQTDRQTTRW